VNSIYYNYKYIYRIYQQNLNLLSEITIFKNNYLFIIYNIYLLELLYRVLAQYNF